MSKPLRNLMSTCYAFRSLALAALHHRDMKTFWDILNSPEFHQNLINVREGSSSSVNEFLDNVFVAYLKVARTFLLKSSSFQKYVKLPLW